MGGQVWKLTIPWHKPHIKAIYVKEVLLAIDEIRAILADSSEENEDDAE